MIDVSLIPVLQDNYLFIARCSETGFVFVVDPAVSEEAESFLDDKGWKLDAILITHHHYDHIGGIAGLVKRYQCPVIGPESERKRITDLTELVAQGDLVTVGASRALVMEVPGHTRGHIVYYIADSKVLFAGDTLFLSGCGRLFEGTPEQMWASLKSIRDLPQDTMVYCAHEYSQANLEFATDLMPNDRALAQRLKEVVSAREKGTPTIPFQLADDCATNPFLRCDEESVRSALGGVAQDPAQVFAEVRLRKDQF